MCSCSRFKHGLEPCLDLVIWNGHISLALVATPNLRPWRTIGMGRLRFAEYRQLLPFFVYALPV